MSHQKPMKWPLPENVHPERTVCFQINVPDEIHYLGAFYGAIFLLSKPYAWGDDAAHTALEVGAVWRDIFDKLIAGNCTIPAKPGSAGADGDDFMIRQNPDNPCLLESSLNGVDWCVFADISLCTPTSQPGGGSPQPQPGGGCQQYHAVLPGNGQWLLPTIVSTGDTINVTGLSGVFFEGGSALWFCPDGNEFFAGICTPVTVTNGGSQLPAVPVGRIIAKIGATYYDVLGGIFTVPGGHANDQVTFYQNSSNLSGSGGSVNFDVEICNNQAGSWTSTFDFTTNPYSTLFTQVWGTYVAGIGYVGSDQGGAAGVSVAVAANATAVSLNTMTAVVSASGETGGSAAIAFYTSAGYYGGNQQPKSGTNFSLAAAGDAVLNNPGYQCVTGDSAGTCSIARLTITGTGTKPAGWP